MKQIGRLHVLTDITLQDRFSHIDITEMAISGGADTIQFRQKIRVRFRQPLDHQQAGGGAGEKSASMA